MNVTTDTLAISKIFKNVGFETEQAEALAEIIAQREDANATKEDLKLVKTELEASIAMLGKDLTIKFGSFMIIAVGIILTAMRYMP